MRIVGSAPALRGALCAFVIAGCGRIHYDTSDAAATDAAAEDAQTDALGPADGGLDATGGADGGVGDDAGTECPLPDVMDLGPVSATRFSGPVLIDELNSTGSEDDPTLTADLLEIYFESDRSGAARLWRSQRASSTDPWDPPEQVTELDAYRTNTPFVSRDGLTLYFSGPPATGANEVIFVATRATRADAWGTPAVVTEWASGAGDTGARTFLEEHGTVFFSSRPGGPGGGDLWLSFREGAGCDRWGAPFPVPGSINTTNAEANAWVREDGLVIAYSGTGSLGSTDILYATRPDRDSDFGAPVELTELSSSSADADPWMSDDMSVVVFASTRTGNVELYQATREP